VLAAAVAAPSFGLVFFSDPGCGCDGCAARPDHPAKRAELRLSRILRVVWKRVESRETMFEVTTEQPYPVLDGLQGKWNSYGGGYGGGGSLDLAQ
jgi:hypothetical protein